MARGSNVETSLDGAANGVSRFPRGLPIRILFSIRQVTTNK